MTGNTGLGSPTDGERDDQVVEGFHKNVAVELGKEEIRRLDAVVEHEVALGHRIRKVPDDVKRSLREEGIDAPEFVRLNRVNPARRRHISEEVQRRYHRDIRDVDVMSNAQVLKAVAERGEWNSEMQQQMETLQRSTTRDMAALWGEGLTPDTGAYAEEILRLCDRFREKAQSIKEDAAREVVMERFDRWVAYGPDLAKTSAFEGYAPFEEQERIFEAFGETEVALTVADLLADVEAAKDKQVRLLRLAEERIGLMELQLRHAKIFANTAESRRDHCEEMAQVYYTCERCSDLGLVQGKLAKAFDDLWDYPDIAVKWLLYESYFFHQNIPDGAREYLETFGFVAAERASGEKDPSAGSPAPQSSNPVGTPAEAMPAVSGASSPDRTSTTAS